jgi:hypothetical protein
VFSSLAGALSSYYNYQFTLNGGAVSFLTGMGINSLVLFLMSVGLYSVFESFRHSDADLYDLVRQLRRAGVKKGIKKTEAAIALMSIYSSFDKLKKDGKISYKNEQEYAFHFLTQTLEIDEEKTKFLINYLNILFNK